MPSSKIRTDYEQLRHIAFVFGREADAIRATYDGLMLASAALESGDWIGPGAQALFDGLRHDAFPGLRRLVEALDAARQSTLRILAIGQQAEADAADALRGPPLAQTSAEVVASGMAGLGSAAIPPRIYIVNGINNRRRNESADVLDLADSMVQLRDYLIRNGSDPAEVLVTAPVYNTNLGGAWLEGSRSAQQHLDPANALTSAFARNVNALIGAAFDAANTAVGAGQVLDEYATRGGGQTQRVDAFVREDLARHPLLPGQGIVLLGHSGGGVIAANLAPRLEGDSVARQSGSPSPLDVLGVATLGAPVVNFDAASQVAPVLMFRHANDPFGLPALRSDEARSHMAGALLALAAGPTGLGTLSGFVGFDLYARNHGASAVVDLRYEPGPAGAHRSYWQDNSTVYRALFDGLGVKPPPK